MAAALGAEGALRRRHRRRRLARAGDRLLPRQEPRHHGRGRSGEELHRLRRRRAQHDDHPRELPHPRGSGVLQGERQALRGSRRRPRLQHALLPAGPPDARPLRPRDHHRQRARRGQPTPRHRLACDLSGRDRPALPGDGPVRERHVAGAGCALPPTGRDHPPRRRGLGLRARRRPAGDRDPPVHGGDRDRALERARHRGRDDPRARPDRHGRQRHGRLVEPRRRPGRRAAPDHDAHPPGLRDRAGEAVPRRGGRLLADARLRLADRPRGVFDRRRDRALHDLLRQGDVFVPRVLGAPRPRALPPARAHPRAALVDRPLRPVSRLQPHSRGDGARRLPRFHGLGNVRVQGSADRRDDARRARRHRRDADVDRPVRARALPHRHPRFELAAAAVSH